ncbi:cytoplasmic dynein 1 intermediate chain-like isoform X2 [Homalodisca vitripennis]|uniref:cytoplasmic dynein 1 intermediate chain-like isoform X2 n=1 Tax=Homalodisca vitripennis TaxID=197043 RepID=UPI001EEA70A1|nr:cytoplasmic dynein 1 intermediate chain-like isoform X2 [Homalodisca vitripennis]
MSDRKAELEKKKAKLQAIREEKERRRREKEAKDAEEAALRSAHVEKDQRKELDEMLSSLGVAPVSEPKSVVIEDHNVLSSLPSVTSTGTPEHNSNNATPDTSLTNTVPIYTAGRKKPQLSVVSVQSTSIPPREMVTYTKQTQTTAATNERDGYFEDWWRPRKGAFRRSISLLSFTLSLSHFITLSYFLCFGSSLYTMLVGPQLSVLCGILQKFMNTKNNVISFKSKTILK